MYICIYNNISSNNVLKGRELTKLVLGAPFIEKKANNYVLL